jgi:hypothetical protein
MPTTTKQPDGHYTRLTERNVWALLNTRRSTLPFVLVDSLQTSYDAFGIVPYSAFSSLVSDVIKDRAKDLAARLTRKIQAEKTLDRADMEHVRIALVLRRSSDWYARGFHTVRSAISYLIVGTHDSCIPFSVYAMDCLKEFKPRATFYDMASPEFLLQRCSQFGHAALLGGLLCGRQAAQKVLLQLPPSTQARIRREVVDIADKRYRSKILTSAKHLRLVAN